jgi:hypothetical protein
MSDEDTKQLEQLRNIVGRVFPAEQTDSFVQYTRLDEFTDDAGEIDEEKVMGHLTAIHAARLPQPAPRQWGQFSAAGGPSRRPGDAGCAEAARRAGRPIDAETAAALGRIRSGPGAAGAAEAQRRFGTKEAK